MEAGGVGKNFRPRPSTSVLIEVVGGKRDS